MTHDAKTEIISGQLQQLLFSPKGGIEGLLVMVGSKSIQISMEPDAADTKALTEAVGKPIEAKGSAGHSPKTKDGAHPVYKLDVITKIAAKTVKSTASPPPITRSLFTLHSH